MVRAWLTGVGALTLLVAGVGSLVVSEPAVALALAVGFQAYELAVAALLTGAALAGLRSRRRAPPREGPLPSLAVIVAAHNERDYIAATLHSIRESGARCEVVVASDGSTDGMNELLIAQLQMVPDGPGRYRTEGPDPVRLLSLPKVGKGAALNRALEVVSAEVVVTLDADTTLEPGSLAAMAARFRDPEVEAAAGFIYVRNAGANLLTRYQHTEYLKNFIWRIGLAQLGVCLQVSGAFGALRTQTLRALGGFAEDSLVEDYEIIYRLHESRRRAGLAYRVVAVPEAAAFTEGPEPLGGFVAQRTRWFTGFLQTLWAYRRMIGSPTYGAVGLFMLPLKCVDALLPLWGLATLAVLAALLASGHGTWPAWAGGLLVARWLLDAALYAGMVAWHHRAYAQRRGRVPSVPAQLATAVTESVGFNWLRQLAVLRAYVGTLRRTQRWEQARWQSASAPGVSDRDPPPRPA